MSYRPYPFSTKRRQRWFHDMYSKIAEIAINEYKLTEINCSKFYDLIQEIPTKNFVMSDYHRKGMLNFATYKKTYVERFLYKAFKAVFTELLQGKPLLYGQEDELESIRIKPPEDSVATIKTNTSVISIKLDRENYPTDHLKVIFSKYFDNNFGKGLVEILEIKAIMKCWYDVLFAHDVELSKVFKLISNVNWVEKSLPKLVSDFGVLIGPQK